MALSSNNHGCLLLTLLLLVSSASSTAVSRWMDTRTTVRFENRLPRGASFRIHCKSGDDDLGVQVVGPNRRYEFKFDVNIWGNTLFFCRVSWARGTAIFDAFKTSRDIPAVGEDRCNRLCVFRVVPTGVEGYPIYRPRETDPWESRITTRETLGARDLFFPFNKS